MQVDRRHVRRAETIDELLAIAVEVMAEQGAAGLSLGEVARRLGIRPPSLYVYVDSKNAVYDELFRRGWQQVHEVMRQLPEPTAASDLVAELLTSAEAFVRWSLEHPVHAQLMAWRPVPGWEPSAAAYAPAVAVLDLLHSRMTALQELGLLRREVPVAELAGAWTVLISGVLSQQLSNAPQEPYDQGRFTRLLPALVAMFSAHYGAVPRTARSKGKKP